MLEGMATVLCAFCYDRFYMCFVHIELRIKGLILNPGVFANLHVKNVGLGCSRMPLLSSLPERIFLTCLVAFENRQTLQTNNQASGVHIDTSIYVS